ncbi:MAG: hypothetical protein MUC49_08270 [Raineya sp.]|jgi:hypothetical protein|nr:hypothetical protein [Raineya sp.]
MNKHLIIDYDLEVEIYALQQKQSYTMLEGLPTKEHNRNYIKRIEEDAEKFCGFGNIYLVEPVETPIHYDGKYFLGDPAELPRIVCIMTVECRDVFQNKEKDYSSLCIIFFQNDFAFPIDSEILEKIKQIPYRQICGEFEY